MVDIAPTEHQKNWWGTQRCRRCNPAGVTHRPPDYLPACPDCDGTGWTKWAAMATSAHTEILPGRLWMGSHDFNCSTTGGQEIVSAGEPHIDDFDVVVSMYSNGECAPHEDIEHEEALFNDGELDSDSRENAIRMALLVASRVEDGKRVLVRCQAGLNRAGLVSALALMYLGYTAEDAIQLLRSKRSPWVLCNEYYVAWLHYVYTRHFNGETLTVQA